MSPILLKSYRIEYETTPIGIQEIRKKYNLTEKQVEKWTKQPQNLPISKSAPVPATLVEDFDKDSLLQDINSFKVGAIKYANQQLEDAEFLEVKEFKDLVSIVSTVETSLKDSKDTGPSINILIQNLSEKFTDDC